jgi:hypothetical protein
MRRILLVLVAVVFLAGLGWSEGEVNPKGAVSFELGGGVIAPIGVGVEFFLGPIGLGAEFRFMFIAVEGVMVGALEPGANVRFYFSNLDSSFFLMGGVSYLTAFAIGEGGAGTAPFGFLKPKAGVGYQALFGKNNKTRFAIELGAVYLWPVADGSVLSSSDIIFPILPHFMIMFGRAF